MWVHLLISQLLVYRGSSSDLPNDLILKDNDKLPGEVETDSNKIKRSLEGHRYVPINYFIVREDLYDL